MVCLLKKETILYVSQHWPSLYFHQSDLDCNKWRKQSPDVERWIRSLPTAPRDVSVVQFGFARGSASVERP